MDKINFWVELKNRWKKDSPIFQEKLQAFGVWLAATGGALIAIPASLNGLDVAEINLGLMIKIASYMILAGTIIKATAKTAVKDADYKTLDKTKEEITEIKAEEHE